MLLLLLLFLKRASILARFIYIFSFITFIFERSNKFKAAFIPKLKHVLMT